MTLQTQVNLSARSGLVLGDIYKVLDSGEKFFVRPSVLSARRQNENTFPKLSPGLYIKPSATTPVEKLAKNI